MQRRSGTTPQPTEESPEKAQLAWCRTALKTLEKRDKKAMMSESAKKKKKSSPEKKRPQQAKMMSPLQKYRQQQQEKQRGSSGIPQPTTTTTTTTQQLSRTCSGSGLDSTLATLATLRRTAAGVAQQEDDVSRVLSLSSMSGGGGGGGASTPSPHSASKNISRVASLSQQQYLNNNFFGFDDDDDDDDEEDETSSDDNNSSSYDANSSNSKNTPHHRGSAGDDDDHRDKAVGGFLKRDPDMRPGIAKRAISPSLARFATAIQQTSKDKFVSPHISEFKDWNIEEMLAAAGGDDAAAAAAAHHHHPPLHGFSSASDQQQRGGDGSLLLEASGGGGGGGARSESTLLPDMISPVRDALRHGLDDAFSPLHVNVSQLMSQGTTGVNAKTHLLRTYDQRLMFLQKRLLMEDASKRRASVRYIREITSTLRHDQKLLDSFTADVRAAQMQRLREHKAAQEVLDSQRSLFLDRTPQQRAADFLQLEKHRAAKVEASRLEQEETFLAGCEDAMAMRRGASYSRQYAWLPHLVLVLTAMKFGKALVTNRATHEQQRAIQAAKKDFSNVFVPTKVTGFLRLAQGYKEAAKRHTHESMGLVEKRFTKAEMQLHQEIKKKKQHYIELKKQELDHPMWAMDRLLAKLRELQFPIFLKRCFFRHRHRSADFLVSFLRTMFQQSVIRVRCQCYLKYHKACGRAFLQAVRNRRTRRNFMWALQFKHYVLERKMFDLGTCVEADHVLRRRERIRQKLALDTKRAYEVADALRQKLLLAQAAPILNKGKNNKTGGDQQDNNNDLDDDGGVGAGSFASSSSPMSMSPGGGSTPAMSNTRPGTGVPSSSMNVSFISPVTPSIVSSPKATQMSSPSHLNLQQGGSSPSKISSNKGGTAAAASSSLASPSSSPQQPQTAVDITRILCAPMMVPHPYGKFGPQPREAALVARATMDHFRVSEIKYAPSDTAMNAILDYVQRAEDKAVYALFCEWISTNREHAERAAFLESVLSHIRDDAPQKPDLEKQYQELIKKKPPPPRQPFVLPSSEMRVLVFAGYTLTAHEKRAASSKKADAAEAETASSKKDASGNKSDPVLQEPNVKLHIAKAMSLFKELHGNIRPFLMAALRDKMSSE